MSTEDRALRSLLSCTARALSDKIAGFETGDVLKAGTVDEAITRAGSGRR